MFLKICAIMLLTAPAAMAAHPMAPYFGVWTGTGSNGQTESILNVTIKPSGSLLTGSYTSRPKRGGKTSTGSFRGQPQRNGCYKLTVSAVTQPAANFEASVCLQQDKSLAVTSLMSNGTVTPSGKFTRCSLSFSTLISQYTGTLYKKTAKIKKKRAVEAAETESGE